MALNQSFFMYADETSCAVLENPKDKVILVGSYFGYGGNFGDILQLRSAIAISCKNRRFQTVTVMDAHAIGSPDYPEYMAKVFGTDAVLFLSQFPLDLQDTGLSLQPVRTVCNVSVLYLYGGGFLNMMWGPYVLGVTNYLLQILQPSTYIISGQQVTPPFEKVFLQHLEVHRPRLLGVRDEMSYSLLNSLGHPVDFSFDDAVEPLQDLSKILPVKRGNGLVLHMNCSGYTRGEDNHPFLDEWSKVSSLPCVADGVTLIQAFSDRRPEVLDTNECIKEEEMAFPFMDTRQLNLSTIACRFPVALRSPVEAEFGIASSYHVALWLQLSGIPCWLRSLNPFYDQKSRALQVDQDFDDFLERPHLADHCHNLERRTQWLSRLQAILNDAPSDKVIHEIPLPGNQSFPFKFRRGMYEFLRNNESLELELGPTKEKIKSLKRDLDNAREELYASKNQLTKIGNMAHLLKGEKETLWIELENQRNKCAEIENRYNEILQTRSWRFTKILRLLARLIRGEFTAVLDTIRQQLPGNFRDGRNP